MNIVTVVTILLLMIPFVAMQFSSEVDWSLFDFFVTGFLLFGTGFTYVLLTTKTNNGAYKAGVAVGLFAGLFLIWANLAVGIIGSENNPVNLLYFGVIAIGIIGGFVSRFRPRGLSFTLFLMAAVIGLIAVGILIYIFSQNNDFTLIDTIRFLGAHGLFIALFLTSGLLFRRVAKD
jgi:hypothetical protein